MKIEFGFEKGNNLLKKINRQASFYDERAEWIYKTAFPLRQSNILLYRIQTPLYAQ